MEKVITRRTVVRTIEEEVELCEYHSIDGTIFDNEEDCLKHDEETEFLSYFKNKYKMIDINPFEYGLNYGNCTFCHLVFIKKLNDSNIDDFIRFYDLKDHPDDINKFVTGWSFIAMINDANLWIFDQTDRKFIVQSVDEAIYIKNNELEILKNLIN